MMTEAGRLLLKADEELRTEMTKLRMVVDALHLKHKEISAEIGSVRDIRAKDQAEIRRLAGIVSQLTVSHYRGCITFIFDRGHEEL